MNVLLLAEEFPGISESFVGDEGPALVCAGHQVIVATCNRGNAPLDEAAAGRRPALFVLDLSLRGSSRRVARAMRFGSGLLTLLRSPKCALRFLRRCRGVAARGYGIAALVERYGPLLAAHADIIHAESLTVLDSYPLAGRVLGVPLVVECRASQLHSLEIADTAVRTGAIARFGGADASMCPSFAVRDRLRALGAPADPHVVRCGVDPEIAVTHAADGVGTPVIAMIAPLDYQAGIEHVLVAIARLVARGVACRARIAGDGPLRAYLRFSAEALGLDQRVEWLGALAAAETDNLLASADVYVTSGVEEQVTRPAVRALAAGLPVVTVGVGDTELVVDGENGLVVAPRDVESLAQAMATMLSDTGLRLTMGAASRRRAFSEFDIRRQASDLENLYATARRASVT